MGSGHAKLFLTQKLTEEEYKLLETRNNDYLKTFDRYESYLNGLRWRNLAMDMKKIGKSNDPDSILSRNEGKRWTSRLHVTLKSMQEEMRKRASNKDLSDMELKKKRVRWYNRKESTYKFVKKE